MAGAEVTSIGDGTPASAAGLRVGDVITAVDGERVESALSLVGHIRERSAGATGDAHRAARREEQRGQGHPRRQAVDRDERQRQRERQRRQQRLTSGSTAARRPGPHDECACSGAVAVPGRTVGGMSHRTAVHQLESDFADAMQRLYSVGNGLARLRAELDVEAARAAAPRPGGPPARDRRAAPAPAPARHRPPGPPRRGLPPAPAPPAARPPVAPAGRLGAPAAPPAAPVVPWYRREGRRHRRPRHRRRRHHDGGRRHAPRPRRPAGLVRAGCPGHGRRRPRRRARRARRPRWRDRPAHPARRVPGRQRPGRPRRHRCRRRLPRRRGRHERLRVGRAGRRASSSPACWPSPGSSWRDAGTASCSPSSPSPAPRCSRPSWRGLRLGRLGLPRRPLPRRLVGRWHARRARRSPSCGPSRSPSRCSPAGSSPGSTRPTPWATSSSPPSSSSPRC